MVVFLFYNRNITGQIDNYNQFPLLEKLRQNLEDDWYIENRSTDCWFHAYRAWLNNSHIPIMPGQLDAGELETSLVSVNDKDS